MDTNQLGIATATPADSAARERPIRITAAFWLWILAVAAGLFEATIAVAQEMLTGVALSSLLAPILIRVLAFTVLVLLALAMRAGWGWSRFVLLVLFTGLGTWSLIADPLSFLLGGGSPSAALSQASGWDFAFMISRGVHIIAVWTASALMFTAPSYFRHVTHHD